MKIRAEINEISIQETKIYQRSQKIIYLKINIINKSLARLSKKKQREVTNYQCQKWKIRAVNDKRNAMYTSMSSILII